MANALPNLSAQGRWQDLTTGFGLVFRALRLIVATPKLLRLSLLCALVTAAVLIAGAVFLWPRAHLWATQLIGAQGWREVAAFALGLVIFVVAYATCALTLPNLLLAPLQDPLSEVTESAVSDFSPPPFTVAAFLRGVWLSLSHTCLRLLLMVLGLALLSPLHFIPVVGSVLWSVVGAVWSSFIIAIEYLSNPMARNFYPFKQVVSALSGRKRLALGFGLGLWLLLWVPVLNSFLVPLAVVAGTLLYRSLLTGGVITPR